MLKADLDELRRSGRVRVEEAVPPDAELWAGADVHLSEPLQVELDLRRLGEDVVARGRLRGRETLPCRRCLVDVDVDLDESVEFLFRSGVTPEEAKREEAYALPEVDRDLDLSDPVREHVLLAAPRYAICDEACRGLCPKCGVRLNEETCECDLTEPDERWAPLRALMADEDIEEEGDEDNGGS